ncbi:MAG: hypothetical protein IT464_02090 [Planctomycetes bacterium]|nr:hypothetical protein [Planctomycetota bacterium]
MPIPFRCPICSRDYRVADENAGRRFDCKSCGNKLTVPGGDIAEIKTGKVKARRTDHDSTAKLAKGTPSKRNVPSDTVILSDKRPPPSSKAAGVTVKSAAPSRAPTRANLELVPDVMPEPTPPPRLPTGLKSPTDLPKPIRAESTRAMPDVPTPRMWNLVLIVGVAAMCTGLFLPWFTPGVDGFGALAGYLLPLKAAELVVALHDAGVYGDNSLVLAMRESHMEYFAFFALYLIPLLGLHAVIDDIRFAGRGKSHWWYRVLAALGPLFAAGAVYGAFRYGIEAWMAAGGLDALSINAGATLAAIEYGLWVLLGGWLLTALSVVVRPKPKYRGAPATKEPKTTPHAKSQSRLKLPKPREPAASAE